jgi:Ca2+-binding RTX toxin-like protein
LTRHRRHRSPRLIVLAATATAALALAPAAPASTATIQNGNRVLVNGPGNEKNQIAVWFTTPADTFHVFDPAGITASALCVQDSPSQVSCPGTGIASVRVTAGGGNDLVSIQPQGWPDTIEADVDGGGGDDGLWGATAADAINGGSGRDIIDGRGAADDMRGGTGTDSVYYGERTTRVIVTVGANNDNDGNELDQTGTSRDTVRGDIETVLGGLAGDILVGDSSDETLFGGDGDDSIRGGRGKDLLAGFTGNDFLGGEDGNDTLRGAAGGDFLSGGDDSDRLAAGPDNDLLRGGPGVDAMKGKGGIDTIQARDGFTDLKISCGPGPNGPEGARRDRRLDPRAKSC